jgi:hypothetical protein
MAVKELSDLNSDGTRLGQTAADLISFHGADPCDQAAHVASVSTSFISTSLGFGFSTSDQAINALTLLNALRTMAVEKGLMASE